MNCLGPDLRNRPGIDRIFARQLFDPFGHGPALDGPRAWNIYFDLLCHLGTLCAVVACPLGKEVWAILKSVQSMALFTVALLPLIPAYFLFKPLRILFAHDAGFFLFAGHDAALLLSIAFAR